ncbi:terminase large subunit domain-containing protein [Asticcacaulis sp. MM231]|uniref:terminase large subunit domain-containing protein n=1 Tax=Asticcacaulis sp. MM231 TaxID=3157666 RepID=UPI0032D57FE1
MGDWYSWLFLGGRGAGKTRAGVEWLAAEVRRGVRCALIGPSLHDVREVMIEGLSGLKSLAQKGMADRADRF